MKADVVRDPPWLTSVSRYVVAPWGWYWMVSPRNEHDTRPGQFNNAEERRNNVEEREVGRERQKPEK